MAESTAQERFWAKVHKTDTCWLWTGARHPVGHGRVSIAGVADYAHRVAYRLLIGDIPDGMILHHRCEVKACVRPDHLEPVTRKQHAAEHGLAGVAKVHADAETCKNGHPFDGRVGQQRICSICKSATKKRHAEKVKPRDRFKSQSCSQGHSDWGWSDRGRRWCRACARERMKEKRL